jgi:hypothetical protein
MIIYTQVITWMACLTWFSSSSPASQMLFATSNQDVKDSELEYLRLCLSATDHAHTFHMPEESVRK